MGTYVPMRDRSLRLYPAYGRDYVTPDAVLADWKSGKDFLVSEIGHVYQGRYINHDDANTAVPLRGHTFVVLFNRSGAGFSRTCYLRCEDGEWVILTTEGGQ